jgi:hypothetical protein
MIGFGLGHLSLIISFEVMSIVIYDPYTFI